MGSILTEIKLYSMETPDGSAQIGSIYFCLLLHSMDQIKGQCWPAVLQADATYATTGFDVVRIF